MVAMGTQTDITYAADGHELSRTEKPVHVTFAMRRTTSNHWQITATLPPAD